MAQPARRAEKLRRLQSSYDDMERSHSSQPEERLGVVPEDPRERGLRGRRRVKKRAFQKKTLRVYERRKAVCRFRRR